MGLLGVWGNFGGRCWSGGTSAVPIPPPWAEQRQPGGPDHPTPYKEPKFGAQRRGVLGAPLPLWCCGRFLCLRARIVGFFFFFWVGFFCVCVFSFVVFFPCSRIWRLLCAVPGARWERAGAGTVLPEPPRPPRPVTFCAGDGGFTAPSRGNKGLTR